MKSRIAWVELVTMVLVISIAPSYAAAETILKGRRIEEPHSRGPKQAPARV
jgi:hypothetical protein